MSAEVSANMHTNVHGLEDLASLSGVCEVEGRDHSSEVYFCAECHSTYCHLCWPLQVPHRKGKARDGGPHQMAQLSIVNPLRAILTPPVDKDTIYSDHRKDQGAKWFGVRWDAQGRVCLADYGRLAALLARQVAPRSDTKTFPLLVSVIGPTGAGKSTIIQMLIQHIGSAGIRPLSGGPVAGSRIHDHVPTSGDVHLYSDPLHHGKSEFIMYADCEGFEGGEGTPLGSQQLQRRSEYVHSRRIEWANTREFRRREFVVTVLYSKLLYTFSDCVVFVLRNPKTFQSAVLSKLLDWAAAALEQSVNHPTLPHCIVVLNASATSASAEDDWGIDAATRALLASAESAMDTKRGVPRVCDLADHWRRLGMRIDGVKDLILCYYQSFKVIPVSAQPQYMRIHAQIGRLRQEIYKSCLANHVDRTRALMNRDAGEFQHYVGSGFDHFTKSRDTCFDFIRAVPVSNPVRSQFGAHVFHLCMEITPKSRIEASDVIAMFEQLTALIASCILLDCVRYMRGGVEHAIKQYDIQLEHVMEAYFELYPPCAYRSTNNDRRCTLVKSRHQRYHQDEKGILRSGEYISPLQSAPLMCDWKKRIWEQVKSLQSAFHCELDVCKCGREESSKIYMATHRAILEYFYQHVGLAKSHASCFSCLMNSPEHLLPCGHVLCTTCVRDFASPGEEYTLRMDYCPLHSHDTKWERCPVTVQLQPPEAGIRVLALESAGPYNILQLDILQAIEDILNCTEEDVLAGQRSVDLPISSLFDLVVGTGTGGLAAALRSSAFRSARQCLDGFSAICERASPSHIFFRYLAHVFGGSPQTQKAPLYHKLCEVFGGDQALFGSTEQFRAHLKVALASSGQTDDQPTILANYRRPDNGQPIERPHKPEHELKTWQAVAATMSSRPLPVHIGRYAELEAQALWPNNHIDLLLSPGTGSPPWRVVSRGRMKQMQNNCTKQMQNNCTTWATFMGHSAQPARCIRFNVPFEDDRFKKIYKIRHEGPYKVRLESIAHRLLATAFYYEVDAQVQDSTHHIGSIKCRFRRSSEDLKGLGCCLRRLATRKFAPYFLVQPNYSNADIEERIPLGSNVINRMISKGEFALHLRIPKNDRATIASVELCLTEDGTNQWPNYISGFPRKLSMGCAGLNCDIVPKISRKTGSTATESVERAVLNPRSRCDTVASGSIDRWESRVERRKGLGGLPNPLSSYSIPTILSDEELALEDADSVDIPRPLEIVRKVS